MGKFTITEEEKRHIKSLYEEQNGEQILTLSNLEQAEKNKMMDRGLVYRGSFGGSKLKGVLVMNYESSEMNKSNHWGFQERIEFDFSEAKPYMINGSASFQLGDFKTGGNIKNDYSNVTLRYTNQQSFGETIQTAESMYYIKAYNSSPTDNLWIFKGADNKWYYICSN